MNFFERLSAKGKVILGFLLMVVFTVGVGAVGLWSSNQLNNSVTQLYERDFLGLSEVREAHVQLLHISRISRQVILDKSPEDVRKNLQTIDKDYEIGRDKLKLAIPKMATEEGKHNTELAQGAFEKYVGAVRRTAELSLEGKKDEALANIMANASLGWEAMNLFDDVVKRKEAVGKQTSVDTATLYASVRNISLAFIAVAGILGILIGLYFANWFGKALTETAQIASFVSRSARELAAATEDIASGAQEQAASIEETAATLEELTSTVKQNAESAQQAAQLASASRETAEKGGRVVNEAVTAMKEVNQSSRKIADITTTIDEIAFQTNILAINAAVEAARAGEQGRGFAVVASEVRSLAERSALATKEIKALIDDSATKIENGYRLVETSGAALGEILGSVKRVTDFVGEIAAASREQSSGIDQVNKAVTQMDQVTQANAAQTEELSSTTESLASQAERLRVVVDQFHLTEGDASMDGLMSPDRSRRTVAVGGTAQRAGSRIRRGAPPARAAAKPVAHASVKREPSKPAVDSDAELDHAFEEL